MDCSPFRGWNYQTADNKIFLQGLSRSLAECLTHQGRGWATGDPFCGMPDLMLRGEYCIAG